MTRAPLKTPYLLSLVALAAAGVGAFFFFQPEPKPAAALSSHKDALIVFSDLPEGTVVEGEALTPNGLTPLMIQTKADGAVAAQADGAVRALIVRVHDTRHYYDLAIGHQIQLSGFEPRDSITLSTADNIIYRDLPMDWAGRLSFDAPARYPATLSVAAGDRSFTMSLMQAAGSAS